MSFLSILLQKKQRRIYLDHAATTPIDEGVLKRMVQVSRQYFANPDSLHTDSVAGSQLIKSYRKQMQILLSAYNHDVVFTRGGTEACNIAVRHALAQFQNIYPDITPRVIISPIEHSAVYELCHYLAERNEIIIEYSPIDQNGVVVVSELAQMLRQDTALIAVQLVNSELGIIQPIKKISHIIRRHRHNNKNTQFPLFFTDAIQAGDTLDIHVQSLGVDYIALSASKFYGPKSGGLVCVPHGRSIRLNSLVGGSQEFGLRPGTVDIALVAGTVEAYALSCKRREVVTRLRELQLYFTLQLTDNFPSIYITVNPELCAPHIIHIAIPGFDSEYAVLYFDANGIDVASQSACSAQNGGISRVIDRVIKQRAVPLNEPTAFIRFSIGRSTTQRDIDTTLRILAQLMKQIYVKA